ncbi:hypothetical protein [Rhodanobacter lindaniclasticus]
MKPTPAPLPRYNTLAVWLRLALYGHASPIVRHMVARNQALDAMAALQAMRT